MAEQFIEELYSFSSMVFELERVVEEIRLFLDENATARLDRIFPDLTTMCKRIIADDVIKGKQLWEEIKCITQIVSDLTSIGDHIEMNILPCIRRYLSDYSNINVDINDKYSIQSTASGYLTLYDKENNLLLHSKNDPMYEAMLYVRSFYNCSKSVYYVYGCGMGYAVYQLYEQSEGFTHIILYEPDDIVYSTAISYGVLSRIPAENLERRVFANIDDFLINACKDNVGILINITSAHTLKDGPEKIKIITNWIWQNTQRKYEGYNSCNRIRNALLKYQNAEVFVKNNIRKEVVVVAAGPSLSDSLSILKDWIGKKAIIAVGKAFTKLLNEKIIPDCIVMIDPTEGTLKQLPENNSEIMPPMLLDDNVYWKIPRTYSGEKYFMKNWIYTGTVSSAAIEVGLRMGAQSIYLVGLDLGYPVLESHAEGIVDSKHMNETGLFKVERTNGGEVFTDKQLNYYREQIEIQISNHPETVFYNLSETGARIQGTKKYHYEINDRENTNT